MRMPIVSTFAASLPLAGSLAQGAEDPFPTKPVTLTVNYGAGGGSDAIARALGRAVEKPLKQPVAIENIAGGAGTRGATAVVTAEPVGYQIGVATHNPMTIAVHSVKGLPWGAPSTYDILGGISIVYNAVCMQTDSPLQTLDDVVKYARQKALRETLFLSGGDLTIFFTRPISAALSALCVTAVVGPTIAALIRGNTSFQQKSEA